MDIFLAFIAGVVCGMSVIVCYGWYQLNKLKKIKDALMEQLKIKASADMDQKKSSIKERLAKASEIAKAQAAIRSRIEMPSKNGLDSRHKNGLVYELQDLEQQKLDLLKTILAEGFDPMITMVNEVGDKTEVPLSTYVNEAIGALGASTGVTPTSSPATPTEPDQPKKIGKFLLYKGGKDDGTTH